ncbi:MAG TPA: hypothetical protein GX715_19290 [Armatimonadetes bacterium]|nr:hypothetical protein [Armatimonadota bacterium]
MRRRTFLGTIGLLFCWAAACGAAGGEAEREIEALAAKVKRFQVVDLPLAPGERVLTVEQSLTVEELRGVPLDDRPPVLGKPAKPYPAKMTDDFPEGEAPYVARGISPFRFRYFNNEFNYGGWHNWAMTDYASAHGFNILSCYSRSPADVTHVPEGTQWLTWSGGVRWRKWMAENGLEEGRYDLLPAVDLRAKLAGMIEHRPEFQFVMLDMEHGLLPPAKLREQAWYPREAGPAEKEAFERRYYEGYTLTYIVPVEVARRAGSRNLSVYGWQPFARTWFGLEKAEVDPATDWAWNTFGKWIYAAVDILNPSVYCFYWSPQNVAYTLANIDLNRKLVESMPVRKPIRPYYWTLLHGGGGGKRWWANQPMPDEDARAMTALGFFTGFDGFDTWNWSGTGNHHRPPPLERDADVMVKEAFECRPEGVGADAPGTRFARYDILRVLSVDAHGQVRFQRVDKAARDAGLGEGKPVYVMAKEALAWRLRPASEVVAAVIEGMALVKPLEYHLRHGEVKVDVPAQEQFAKKLPIVRRVKLGRTHVIATYDPICLHGGEPREITLPDFDGHKGLILRLPADEQTRVFVLRER